MNRFAYGKIDPRIREALDAYAQTGRPVGSFLTAVLSNDLFEACARADPYNLDTLPIITAYVFNHLPAESYGSRESMESWIAHRGQVGRPEATAAAPPAAQPLVQITLESTAQVEQFPPPARLWLGRTAEDLHVMAWITLASTSPRLQRALEERVTSQAVITIPTGLNP